MSAIGKGTTTGYLGFDTEASTFEHHNSELLTHPVNESEDFAELVKKLTKSSWFCEVAEA